MHSPAIRFCIGFQRMDSKTLSVVQRRRLFGCSAVRRPCLSETSIFVADVWPLHETRTGEIKGNLGGAPLFVIVHASLHRAVGLITSHGGDRVHELKRPSGDEEVLRGEVGVTCDVDPQAPEAGLVARRGDMGDVHLATFELFELFHRELGGRVGRGTNA